MRIACCVVALVFAGCGSSAGGAAGAEKFDGYWQVSAATLPSMTSVTRTSSPLSLRADYTFAATDATHGRLRGRLAILQDDELHSLSPMDAVVTIDKEEWVVVDGSSTAVFGCAEGGERLTLTLDVADPRNVSAESVPRVLTLRRMAAPPSDSVGTWRMVEIDLETMTVPGDTCFTLRPGMWVKVQLTFAVDARHLMERILTASQYLDAGCTRLKTSESLGADGVMEETATTLDVWARSDDESMVRSQWTLTRLSARRMQLTRICAAPPCDDPSRLVVEKTD